MQVWLNLLACCCNASDSCFVNGIPVAREHVLHFFSKARSVVGECPMDWAIGDRFVPGIKDLHSTWHETTQNHRFQPGIHWNCLQCHGMVCSSLEWWISSIKSVATWVMMTWCTASLPTTLTTGAFVQSWEIPCQFNMQLVATFAYNIYVAYYFTLKDTHECTASILLYKFRCFSVHNDYNVNIDLGRIESTCWYLQRCHGSM